MSGSVEGFTLPYMSPYQHPSQLELTPSTVSTPLLTTIPRTYSRDLLHSFRHNPQMPFIPALEISLLHPLLLTMGDPYHGLLEYIYPDRCDATLHLRYKLIAALICDEIEGLYNPKHRSYLRERCALLSPFCGKTYSRYYMHQSMLRGLEHMVQSMIRDRPIVPASYHSCFLRMLYSCGSRQDDSDPGAALLSFPWFEYT